MPSSLSLGKRYKLFRDTPEVQSVCLAGTYGRRKS